MKGLFVLMLGLAVAAAPVFAEETGDQQGKGPRGGDRMARMQEHLGLSDEQVQQMRQIRENGGGREEMHAVLTGEQLATLEEHRSRMKGRGDKRGGRGKDGAREQGERGDKPDDG